MRSIRVYSRDMILPALLVQVFSIFHTVSPANVNATNDDEFSSDTASLYRRVFFKGAPLTGGSNGMYFDPADDNLYVAQVYGGTISKIDPESGNVLESIASGGFPDDVTVGPDGTLYWTDPFLGTIFSRRRPSNDSSSTADIKPLLDLGSVPFVNSLTMSDDGGRLFYGQCWKTHGDNAVFQLDLGTGASTTIVDGIYGCASNGMDFRDGALYTPRPFEGRVVRIDLNTTAGADVTAPGVTNVTTEWGVPNAVKFDSLGILYAINTGNGEIVRVNVSESVDTINNREVLATMPVGSIDNLALDASDRLYVSSTSDGRVFEVLMGNDEDGGEGDGVGTIRTVSPGGMSVSMGLALSNDHLYTVNPGALYEIDVHSGRLDSVITSIPAGVGPLSEPTSVAAWGDDLVLMSFTTGILMVWDPLLAKASRPPQSNDSHVDSSGGAATDPMVWTASFDRPVDATPFRDGLLVTEMGSGDVVYASGPELSERDVVASFADDHGEGPRFLAGDDGGRNVYVTTGDGSIMQIVRDGVVVDPPASVSEGHDGPEGIALCPDGEALVVVNGGGSGRSNIVEGDGTGTVEVVDVSDGKAGTKMSRVVISDGHRFVPGRPGLRFGLPNDVAVRSDGVIYVNDEGANVIYEIGGGCNVFVAKGDVASTSAVGKASLNPVMFSLMSTLIIAMHVNLIYWIL